jgi:hypothetical protein
MTIEDMDLHSSESSPVCAGLLCFCFVTLLLSRHKGLLRARRARAAKRVACAVCRVQKSDVVCEM